MYSCLSTIAIALLIVYYFAQTLTIVALRDSGSGAGLSLHNEERLGKFHGISQ